MFICCTLLSLESDRHGRFEMSQKLKHNCLTLISSEVGLFHTNKSRANYSQPLNHFTLQKEVPQKFLISELNRCRIQKIFIIKRLTVKYRPLADY